MQKIVITYPTYFPAELEQIVQLLENDSCLLHLRKPDYSEAEYETLLQSIPASYHPRVVLHDYYHLADKYAVGGMHFSTKNRTLVNEVKVVGTRSTSTHSLEDLQVLDGEFDYAFLSPIFSSISKQGYEGNLDMKAVQAYLQKLHQTKVIALGGIDERKLLQIEQWAFDGYAMLGCIWKLK